MNQNKYLQLSISAFITAVVIGLGWIINEYGLPEKAIPWINGGLLGISILIGLFFLYKSQIDDSKTGGSEWVNNLVEKAYQVIPQIALVPPLLVSVIILTQNISNTDQEITNAVSTLLFTISYPTTEVSPSESPTPSETSSLPPTVSPTLSPTPTETSTQIPTITPTSEEIMGCVITHGLNVRYSPGMIATPSNHAKIWLTYGACMTILETTTPQWARARFEGWVRLNMEETEYVDIVTPSGTLTPTVTQP